MPIDAIHTVAGAGSAPAGDGGHVSSSGEFGMYGTTGSAGAQGSNPARFVILTPEEEELERKRIRALFDRIDTDKNGMLGASELQEEIMRLNLPFAQNQIRDIMAQSDRNKDGRLDFDEFFNYCMEKEKHLREVFDAIDQARDNLLNIEELKASFEKLGFKVTDNELKRMIRRISKYDDKISWTDWREFMVLFPTTHVRDMFRYLTPAPRAHSPSHWQKAALLGDDNISLVPDDTDADDEVKGRWWRQLLSGGVAGAVSRSCTAPLDRLKIMLQVQTDRKGLWFMLSGMLREGGLVSFWRGNGVNVLKIAPESAIKFLAWEQAKRLLYHSEDDAQVTLIERLAAGSIAGVVSQTTIFPFEVLKTRLATAQTGQYKGLWHCAQTLSRSQGLSVFYRGLSPSLIGVIPYAGIDLAVYETLKEMYVARNPGTEPSVLVLMACGATSSSVGQLASYPLALVRTRMQAFDNSRGMVAEFESVLRSGGVTALYRGLVPNFLKVAPAVGISYVIYERMKLLLKI